MTGGAWNDNNDLNRNLLEKLRQAIVACDTAGHSWANATSNKHRLVAAGNFLLGIQALLAKEISPEANRLLDALIYWPGAYALGHDFPLLQQEKTSLAGSLNMTELSWRAYFRVAYQLFMDAKVPKKDAIDNILEVVKKHNIPLPEGKTTDKKNDKKRLLNAINNFKANCKNYITTDTALEIYNKAYTTMSARRVANQWTKLQTAQIFLNDILPSFKDRGFTSVEFSSPPGK